MTAVELFLTNTNSDAVCEKLGWKKLPAVLQTYLFCNPSLDTKLRCLPRDGGYYDQYYVDVKWFRAIEAQIISHTNRKNDK